MRSGGFCTAHYQRHRRGVDMDAPLIDRHPAGGPCRVDGCDKPAKSLLLCNAHYLRHREGRPIDTPLRGYGIHRHVGKDGYAYLWSKSIPSRNARGYTYEHRYVMERMIGRSLLPGETVHHKNGIRDDNRPANLELWASGHPGGQRIEDLLAWARQIITTYADLEDTLFQAAMSNSSVK
jgi:hypothetical protein